MGELTLEQVINLSDALENDDYELCKLIVRNDDQIDSLEKQNDNLSQTAILEAVANRNNLGMGVRESENILFKKDPLRFALSAIRITRNMERMADQAVNCANVFKNGRIQKGTFKKNESLNLILQRVITLAGMSVESLVEEKERFMGSVNNVEDELNFLCLQTYNCFIADPSMEKPEFSDLYRILLALERIGDYAVNVAEELVRLNTGYDIRHKDIGMGLNVVVSNE